MTTTSTLPPDLFDTTTLVSLGFTVLIVAVSYSASLASLRSPAPYIRFLFTWHLADALCHFILEGSFLYHCFFSWVPSRSAAAVAMYPTPEGYLGTSGRVYGAQAGGESPLALLWMVYARADKRWAGVDLGVVSLEILTVFFDGLLALYICYCLARKDPKANVWMIVLATCELYGGKSAVSDGVRMTDESRLHDVLPRVARGQCESRYQQLHVQVVLSGVLQYAVGVYSAVCYLVLGGANLRGVWEAGGSAAWEEEEVDGTGYNLN